MDELMGAIPSPDPIAAKTIRVCKVARKFLVFDLESVTILRRVFHTSGTLVGTTPQQPAQNIFLGLPVELTSDEAGALVQNGVAYVVDAAEAHRETLGERFLDLTIRSAYVEVLRQRILTASHAHTVKAVKSPPGIRTRLRSSCMPSELSPRLFDGAADGFSSVQNPGSIAKTDGSSSNCKRDLILGLTLNSSVDLIARPF
ncbi:hypothetical protein XA68_11318 [Ophiocordyceps unilateralis]|uniref:TSEN34 N-terminal domain-containing protein n=1 Tax=Ophiocordyceps unilateralis TaxID=268505 RepID=A0A2A9NZH8_OPHUN|nr:hypothetical protein XA68_11318 [Ophiocordyceps unilateralis]